MRIIAQCILAMAVMVTACGAAVEEPVEQIIVRAPGEAFAPAPSPVSANAEQRLTPIAETDLVVAGEQAFGACSGCHAVEADAGAGPGPNLNGVFGRKAGSRPGFAYSDAITASGIIWNADSLDGYLTDPVAKIPGTAMVSGAVADADQRAAIIAYLASISP